MTMKITVLWGVTLCSVVHTYQLCLHIQGRPYNEEAAGSVQMLVYISTRLHSGTSQKIVTFIQGSNACIWNLSSLNNQNTYDDGQYPK
jgi:hypothetical protein